ncbi:cytochrome c oxidase assembly factor Coa1 family protein [Budvicia diplopodorum]|uniref:cytochrome c oxidase assembly factor Coa1 family protein n=1 Tax=Budvicia diplopodorum TaxID=1119056 RepID=UPI00135B7134|nr:cytochrome c oxidase assembly factor Coa1 family protein [Budvicia diplopodorum]
MENSSGNGISAEIPAEIRGWNWGAFLLHWIWGIGNNTFIAFLVFIPFVNLVMPFVLGAKGNEWAWRNKKWASVEEFKRIQRLWARWALGLILFFILMIAGIIMVVISTMKSSDVYKESVALVTSNPVAAEMLGTPISSGIPSGNISVSGHRGSADISFSVEGSKSSGTVYVVAHKEMGDWIMESNRFKSDQTGDVIDLLPPSDQ